MAGSDQAIVLEEFTDSDGCLRSDYQKLGEGPQAPREIDRPMLYFPRCSSAFEVFAPKEGLRRILDARKRFAELTSITILPRTNWFNEVLA